MVESSIQRGPIGLVAGWGDYPLMVANALRRQGYRVCGLGIKDHADPRLAEHCDDFGWVGLARLGAAIRFFRRRGVRHAMMAGKVHKTLLFRPWAIVKHFPDWTCIKAFYPHFIATKQDRKDDTLLGTIVKTFATGGVEFHPATDFAPELLVKPGPLTNRRPSAGQQADIEFGWRLAKEMGRLDVGQSVAVKDRAVLAVEAIEGTDECIRRAGLLCPKGGFTVVKVAKPQQDMRFDVPTIGLGTVRTMVEAGGRVLAIEAGRTIILEELKIVEFAERHGLVVVAVAEQQVEGAIAA
jgi:DUF1009 family protein